MPHDADRAKCRDHDHIVEIETAYRSLALLLGLGAAGLFMLALLASGFSSSIVGVHGRLSDHERVCVILDSLWLRRLHRNGAVVSPPPASTSLTLSY